MSFRDCIQRAVEAGATDKQRGAAATEMWQETADAYERMGYSRHLAEVRAAEDVEAGLKRSLQRKRHEVMAQLAKERENFILVEESSDASELTLRRLEASTASGNRIANVVGEMNALRTQFNGQLSELLKHHSRDLLGRVRKKALLKDVTRELHGESTGSAEAKAVANAVRDTFERMRLLYNAAGGDMGKLENFGIPHKHDRRSIMSAGDGTQEGSFRAWFDEIAPRLDWTKIDNYATGRPFSTDGMPPARNVQEAFLREIHETIWTDGLNKLDLKWGGKTGKALSRRHNDPRVLHFRSADDWMSYNDRFGASGPFEAIMGHSHKMARDIAMMRVLGPSHTVGLENLHQHVMKKVAGDQNAEERAKRAYVVAKSMLDDISGRSHVPYRHATARFFSGTRQVLSAAHLGSAMLVSGSDSVAMGLAARSVGMNPQNVVSRHIGLLASSANRETAAQMLYVADTLSDAGNTAARFAGEAPSSEVTERLSSFVMRAQGLAFWTDMARIAFQMEFAGNLANARSLNDLDPALSSALRQRGISDADWALFSNPDLHFKTKTGERFASPLYWMNAAIAEGADREVAERIGITIDALGREYGEIAVPSINYEMRNRLAGGMAQPGTVQGELQRSFMSYKSYAMTFSINQYRQIWAAPGLMRKVEYVLLGAAGFIFMGVVGVQLKEIAKGNDPRPMDDPKFWAAAIMQGGGLGIVGDLFNSAQTRLGGGLAGYVGGPMVGLSQDLFNLTAGNATQALQGKDTNIGREAVNFMSRNTPGTTLWPIRAAGDRMLWDQLQKVLDPDADRAMQQQVRRQQNDYGNGPYWQPGEFLPDRMPSFSG